MSGVISALPVRNSTLPCRPSSSFAVCSRVSTSLALCAVAIFCDRSSSCVARLLLAAVSAPFSVSSAALCVCSPDLSLSNAIATASAFDACPARCTRFPSQVPRPATRTAPTGPAANPPITAPATNPAGSCGGAVLGASAKAAALTPTKPIVQTTLEHTVFITAPHSVRQEATTAASWELLRPYIQALRRSTRGKSWRRGDEFNWPSDIDRFTGGLGSQACNENGVKLVLMS